MHTLGITLGDCAGIGPEIVIQALQAIAPEAESTRFVLYGNRAVIDAVTARLSLPPLAIVWYSALPDPLPDCALIGIDSPFPGAALPEPGHTQAVCGEAARRWICAAASDALAGRIDAVVTAPISKAALHLAGYTDPGHTELLAACCFAATGVRETPCMAFWSPKLILSLATIHTPLAAVPGALTVPGLTRVITLTDAFAARMAPTGAHPRTGVLALNPHAGEAGAFGDEEARLIQPAIDAARRHAVGHIEGPLVADTAFTWLTRPEKPPFDAYVALYHDQGLIPFKALAFDSGVNVTLGLPLIRTSPDHGTAFDIAWRGIASPGSMIAAIDCALRILHTKAPAHV